MEATITKEKLDNYFSVTQRALEQVKKAFNSERKTEAAEVLDMAQRYHDDAHFFLKKGDAVTAFAALNYAHGWLDAGARLGLFLVHDSALFTVDGEN